MTRDFTDESEKDVEYATGAKDVEDEHYGWACAITSQEISYAYGPKPGKDMPPSAEELPVRAEEDLLLTIIVMYQKYTVQYGKFKKIIMTNILQKQTKNLCFIQYINGADHK